jgi:regulator of sirC expression with transglutaminase-like and TPR domain
MLEDSKIKALLSLLEDPDETVGNSAIEALSQCHIDQTPLLDAFLYTHIDSELAKQRLEFCIDSIRVQHFGQQILDWKAKDSSDLILPLAYIAQFKYPDVKPEHLREQIESLRLDAWLEFHYDLTSFEKVKILNYILFQLHGFRANEADFLNPDNSYFNQVLNTKKGNPIALSIVYILVAQRLNIPVYGINLPRHFIMAYVEDQETENLDHFNDKQSISHIAKGEIKFYINAYNGGGVFNQEQLSNIIKEMGLPLHPQNLLPCSNEAIILRVLMNLYNSYQATGQSIAHQIDKIIQAFQA